MEEHGKPMIGHVKFASGHELACNIENYTTLYDRFSCYRFCIRSKCEREKAWCIASGYTIQCALASCEDKSDYVREDGTIQPLQI